MPNPYSCGPMVTDPRMFFGREEELRTLYTRLSTMQSTSIVGLRRIGKSSLLYRLAQTVRDELGQNYLPLYIDLQDARYRTAMGFVAAVAGAMNERMGGILDVGGVTDMAGFTRLVERLRDNGVYPVLCLDEFEELVQHPQEFGDDFLEGLRALGSHGKLALVTASRVPLADLIQKQELTSPFFNIFSQIELGLLEPEAARALRRVPFEREGVILTPEEEALVEELAGRHPFYLQMACHHLYEAQAAPAGRRADLVRERFNQEAEPHFQQLWEHLDDREQAALRSIVFPAGGIRKALERLLGRSYGVERARMARLGVVEKANGSWQIFSKSFTDWVQRYPGSDSRLDMLSSLPPLGRFLVGISVTIFISVGAYKLWSPALSVKLIFADVVLIILVGFISAGWITPAEFMTFLRGRLGLK